MKDYIERIEATKEQKEEALNNEPYDCGCNVACNCDDMYNEPKIPELIDVLADIEVMFYKYEKAMVDDDLVTALKYKEAILKIKAVTENV